MKFGFVVLVVALSTSFVRPDQSVLQELRASGGVYNGCPMEGRSKDDGKRHHLDTKSNLLKNRFEVPREYRSMTITQVCSLPHDLLEIAGSTRLSWGPEANQQASASERLGVAVEGYVKRVNKEQPEDCNCHSTIDRDYHLVLTDDSGKMLVAEVNPRSLALNGWSGAQLKRLADQHAHVRVCGWLFWDSHHEGAAWRSTQWEVHPVLAIQVEDGGQWVSV